MAALTGSLTDTDRVGLAVSGGPDSLAMLLLAHAAFPGRIAVATVDHGLRAGSAVEATFVAGVCRARTIPHATLVWHGPKLAAGLQAAARAARYSLLAKWCEADGLRWLATAHHADDQAETVLMRLSRAGGLAGLSGIRARRELGQGVTLIRPLLGERRAALAAVVVASGLAPVRDPANADPRFHRPRVRALLAATSALDPSALARSAAHLADAEEALAWTADLAWAGRAAVDPSGAITLDATGLPRALRLRLLARVLHAFAARPDGPALARLLVLLDEGRSSTLGGVMLKPAPDGRWNVSPAPPRRPLGPCATPRRSRPTA